MHTPITRRRALGLGAAALALSLIGVRKAEALTPNILIILTDDQPPYLLDPMPQVRGRIRDMGAEFSKAHTDIPLCGPARVGILTGLSVTTHECNTNRTWGTYANHPMNLQQRTIAKYAKDAGYVTGHFGKYVNGHGDEGTVPPHWDRWVEPHSDDGPGGQANVDGMWVDIPATTLPSIWSAGRVAEFIRGNAGPWLAHYCPTIPHAPYTPSADSEHLYDGARRDTPAVNEADMSDKLSWMRDLPPTTGNQGAFEGEKEELADLDSKGIKNILDTLVETGQMANTLIFFTSDNGFLFGEHRMQKKDKPYWESAQIPFFVKGPGVQNMLSTRLVSHVDIMPTALDFMGVPVPADVDGRSLKAPLTGNFTGWRNRMLVTGSDDVGPELNPGGANYPSGRWWMLVEGAKRYIRHENGSQELYWMDTDPWQESNKAQTAPQSTLDDARQKLIALRGASGAQRRQLEQ